MTFGQPRVMGMQYQAGDDPKDVALCREIGTLLSKAYPGWAWGVEIPPGQDAIVIRNLDCDPRGRMGMFQRKSQLTPGRHEIVIAAGEFLERYRMRTTANGHQDVQGRNMLFERPDQ